VDEKEAAGAATEAKVSRLKAHLFTSREKAVKFTFDEFSPFWHE